MPSAPCLRPALFFDRDGVLNVDTGYAHRPEALRWVDGAMQAVRLCNEASWYVFVVTNQSGVARGYFTEADVRAFHERMQADLGRRGAHVDAFVYCPHHPGGAVRALAVDCACRKPKPGMLLELLARWPVDAARSLLIGDSPRDLEAAAAAGVRGALFRGGDLAAFLRSLELFPAPVVR